MKQKLCKIGFCITLITVIILATPSVLQAQIEVEDDFKNTQLQREVWWDEWDGHDPSWFYWLIELFQDDEYRDQDRRNFLQLFPTIAMTGATKYQSEEQKKKVDKVAQDKLFILADLEIDYAYELIKSELNEQRGRVVGKITKARQIGVYPAMVREIGNEYERIERRIYTIKKSDLTNADRQKGYQSEVEALRKLNVVTSRIIIAFEAVKR